MMFVNNMDSVNIQSKSDIDDGKQNTVDLSNQTDQGRICNINDVHKGHGLNKYTESERNIVDGQQNTVDLSNQMDQGSICNINDVCKQHGPSKYTESESDIDDGQQNIVDLSIAILVPLQLLNQRGMPYQE